MRESRAITRRSASNLALAFCLLPKRKRDAMSALYAFCREVDDVADNQTAPGPARRAQLAAWRADVQRACAGQRPEFPVTRELQPVIQEYRLPLHLFEELLNGVEMDLEIHRYDTFDALELYCYRVAAVVGLLSIEIFGYQNPACRKYAVYLGKALQLTNILRDVRTDAQRGRIYLPLSELARFNLLPDEILGGQYSERFAQLAGCVAERAKNFYRQARQTLPAEDRRAMIAAELMGAVYWRLLTKLERRRFNVFDFPPVKLNGAQKLGLIFGAWWRFAPGANTSKYGLA